VRGSTVANARLFLLRTREIFHRSFCAISMSKWLHVTRQTLDALGCDSSRLASGEQLATRGDLEQLVQSLDVFVYRVNTDAQLSRDGLLAASAKQTCKGLSQAGRSVSEKIKSLSFAKFRFENVTDILDDDACDSHITVGEEWFVDGTV
jgi:hypothetical protein